MEEHWSSVNFFRNFSRQKKVFCMWFKMHILHFYFAGFICNTRLYLSSTSTSHTRCWYNVIKNQSWQPMDTNHTSSMSFALLFSHHFRNMTVYSSPWLLIMKFLWKQEVEQPLIIHGVIWNALISPTSKSICRRF